MSKFDIPGRRENRWSTPGVSATTSVTSPTAIFARLSPVQRQPILDELEGRFQAEQKGMKPVYDEISFLAKLCKLAQADQFQPNLGIKVNESRHARDVARQRRAQKNLTTPKETEAQRQKRLLLGQERIMTMRKALGTSQSSKSANAADDS